MSARDFLVEIGTEELPPKALPELERAFRDGVAAGVDAAGLTHGAIESFAAPRRLAVLVRALATRQPEQQIRRRGPPVSAAFDAAGQPTRAASAFADSCGVGLGELTRVREGKGEFLFYSGRKAGAETATLLPAIVQAALDQLPIPRRMRWGAGDAQFVRPVHWIVLLFGGEALPVTLLDTAAGNATRGHRFHAPAPIALAAPADYADALRSRGKVLASFGERREKIRAGVEAAAAGIGGRVILNESLLDEVTALVEWPVAVTGRFEDRFLELPRELLISTLQDHQRYFAVEDADGRLTPWFITVSNIESREPAQVRAGNERVVRPRLADAAFFWQQDRREPLAARLPGLDTVTFQAKLGSLGAKAKRIVAISESISTFLGWNVAPAARAALLAKCDLLTALVGEFPDLQGIMGAYYAAADGEPAVVATAIREHYLPRGAGDALPETGPGTAVALADRLDTLAGIFAIGQKPTGTRDPFGLRRAAIGVLRILIEKRIDLDLRAVIDAAVALQPVRSTSAADEVYGYVMERLRAYYLEQPGTRYTTEMIDAVLATAPRAPLDFDARLTALADFLTRPEATSLAAANKRIANILKKAEGFTPAAVETSLLREPAERALAAAIAKATPDVAAAVAKRDYAAALSGIATLHGAVDDFFDGVMVNDSDEALRRNRLSLIASLQALVSGIADLSRLPG
ncbi:MAG: glycine--tRNA ligase subunit beta [Steroidobacteraceae bacterium]|nr:glycine--tRNA ligase subunit beta [Steroidobacteraceae bacterium]